MPYPTWLNHTGVVGLAIALDPGQQAVLEALGWVVTDPPLGVGEDFFRELWTIDIGDLVPPLVEGLIPDEYLPPSSGDGLTFADAAAMWSTETAVSYNSGTHKLDITFPSGIDAETAQDLVAAMLAGSHAGLTVTYDDTAGTITLAIDLEYLQDAIAEMFDGSHTNATVTYDDTTGKLVIEASASGTPADDSITQAMLQDGIVNRDKVDSDEIPAYNTDGSLDVEDSEVGVLPDAGTASSHGWTEDLAATIVALIGGNDGGSFSGNAADVDSDSTVGGGNVEEDLNLLDAQKADGSVVDQKITALADLLGGTGISDSTPATTGQGTRVLYKDDFRWSEDINVTLKIGETRCSRGGTGTFTAGTQTAFRPGVVRLATSTTASTYTYIAAPIGMAFAASGYFEADFFFRPVTVDSNTLIRCGLSSDPTSETPTDGLFVEKLGADSAFWRNVSRIASTELRATSAVATTANTYVHLRIRRLSDTHVGFSSTTTSGGVPGAWSGEETVAYAATTLVRPFLAVKNGSTAEKFADLDLWQTQHWDVLR